MTARNGIVLYHGPSVMDPHGRQVVAIATGLDRPSANRKTGPMVQTWILCADADPVAAVRLNLDAAICGDCPHRGTSGSARACYVNVGQAPLAVWRAWKRGAYAPRGDARMYSKLEGRAVRIGSYGDPAAVPMHVWTKLRHIASNHTGYTHQWRTAPGLRDICMASVDSRAEAAEAQAAGWRTFRVAPKGMFMMTDEVHCPADLGTTQCDNCTLCAGMSRPARSVMIPVHGSGAKHFQEVGS